MNSVVIYRSKYGASARYARMLAETLAVNVWIFKRLLRNAFGNTTR